MHGSLDGCTCLLMNTSDSKRSWLGYTGKLLGLKISTWRGCVRKSVTRCVHARVGVREVRVRVGEADGRDGAAAGALRGSADAPHRTSTPPA